MTPLKVRKLLITAGAFTSDTTKLVQRMYADGNSIKDIMQKLQLSRASVHSYLPYLRHAYKQEELSANAERIRLWRIRQEAINKLQDSSSVEQLWKVVEAFAGYPFHTVKNMKFKYTVSGYEIFVNRKEKSITRSTVEMAYNATLELGADVTGPKKLGTFGASYLYPMCQHLA